MSEVSGVGLLDRLVAYAVGRRRDGWRCGTCDRRFIHEGKPRRTFLALLDHVVIDHRRLPYRYTYPRSPSVGGTTYTTSSSASNVTISFGRLW